MLSPVNRDVHLTVKVGLEEVTINALVEWVCENAGKVLEMVMQQVLLEEQERAFAAVEEGRKELVCGGCGVVHEGPQSWSRRGMRERTVRTSRGVMRLPLLQSTCGGCGKTRGPWAEALGLEPRRRISPELRRKAVEQVPGQSYHRSVRTLHECLGVRMSASTLHGYVQEVAERVELTPLPDAEVVIADGTKIRAGKRTMLEDLRLGFQWMGCSQRGKRRRTNLRLIAVDVGRGSWKTVLRGDARTTLVVTDAEAAVASHVRARYPKARHQYCEWHVGYTLGYSLREDGVSLQERRALQREMRRILWGKGSQEQKRALYDGFTERMACYPKTHTQLQRASPHILFPEPSQVRTTSVVERQMREVDRRAWIGVRWSVRGLRNLILLSLTRTHNPDDYERVWMN